MSDMLPILASIAALILGVAVIIRLVLSSPSRAIDRKLRELAAGRQPVWPARRDYRFRIGFDSTGFTVSDLHSRSLDTVQMDWSTVTRVTAFKRDLFAVDCLCIFLSGADDAGIEVDEDMEGWTAFCEALQQYLPGCLPFAEWIRQVASPAFALNATELYVAPR